ncbi:type III secretion system chaperone [Polycladidibacter hongkongensis]|uniref:type III secretion system chaperone n=1 Tax=Polycladidibacter hongkongensis TaxID=1647556 RepID=UPI00082D54A7|nr:type III secretion system chaperone [Pseudovibrio hongkongensis]
MKQLVNSLFAEIGARIGIDQLTLDENGRLFLALENNLIVAVKWRETSQTLLFSSPVYAGGSLPAERFAELLEANCHFADGHGMAFNIESEKQRINLSMIVGVADRCSIKLMEKIEVFVEAAAHWNSALGKALHERSEYGSEPFAGADTPYLMGLGDKL